MSTVRVTIGPRTYTIGCSPGEEPEVERLAAQFASYYERQNATRAPQETQNFLIAALIMASDLEAAHGRIAKLDADLDAARHQAERGWDEAADTKAALEARLDRARLAQERSRREVERLRAASEQANSEHANTDTALAEQLETLADTAERVASELEGRAQVA
ncbi:MAG: cell division protein ZapA [Erythrobacter sp.]|jgi:cell division protein ZapA|nr:cell division protein ZapA [Erythrobacter sp.]